MADVTISQLGVGTPTTGIVVPWSYGTTTYQAKLSSLITAQGDMGTVGIQLPKGTTSQRVNVEGMLRYNSSFKAMEYFDGTNWNLVGNVLDGSSENRAAPSAEYIKLNLPGAVSGLYWIRPTSTSTAFQTYCDMTYDGGGWILAFAYAKNQFPVQLVTNYYSSPQNASAATGNSLNSIATPNDPKVSFCLPDTFWAAYGSNIQGRGELREEICISGGTWPNNTNRVVIFHGGRTSGGGVGNFLTSTNLTNIRQMYGWGERGSIRTDVAGSISRGGYLSNNIGVPSNLGGGSTGASTVLGFALDASNLSFTNTDGIYTYTNQAANAGSSWMGRGNCCGQGLGSSNNGAEPNGTRWGLVFIR